MGDLYARIVFNRPLSRYFHYRVPETLRPHLAAGMRVRVPFGRGNRPTVGHCVGFDETTPAANVKPVLAILDDQPLVGPRELELTAWMADYYACAWGQVLEAVVPAGVKKASGTRAVEHLRARADAPAEQLRRLPPKQAAAWTLLAESARAWTPADLARAAGCTPATVLKLKGTGLVEVVKERISDSRVMTPGEGGPEDVSSCAGRHAFPAITLNADQAAALRRLEQVIDEGRFHPVLLYGVTGSGKTEVYLRAIARVVQAGREAIVLVPEISLTPQTIERFRSRFDRVAVLHSHLTDVQRRFHWQRIAAGQAQVVVGARSAVFAPTRRLGLIVIDEEHETTFKQDTVPRYHARDVAVKRAQLEGIPIVLGSATPSLESWHNARTGRYELLRLPRRVRNLALPRVHLVDLRDETDTRLGRRILSRPLVAAMREALDSGGQVMLLLNRRGFNTFIHCPMCGHVLRCRHCDIGLVYYRRRRVAVCHYCRYEASPPEACPECGRPELRFQGSGTERLEAELADEFPHHTCLRMDSDTMRRPGSYERTLAAFRRGQAAVLLGTQMIAKGLDFPNVTLVGVVNADTALALPDFRAAERTFQLVAQVAGRTGRGDRPGRVIVQTFNAQHPSIRLAARHDFEGFAEAELADRHKHGYPPFGRLARIIFRGPDPQAAGSFALRVADRLRETIAASGQAATVLGPAPAPVERIQDQYRWHLLLRGRDARTVAAVLRGLADLQGPASVQWAIDVDPIQML